MLFPSATTPAQPVPLLYPNTRVFQVGGVTILLDCGWDIHFDTALLEPLREVVRRVDLVLISHSDLEHLGVRARAGRARGLFACLEVPRGVCRGYTGLAKLVVFPVLEQRGGGGRLL